MPKRAEVEQVKSEYVTVKTAQALTDRSAWTWRRDAYAGRVASVKIGRMLLIPRSEIDRIMRENLRPALAAK